MLIDFVRQINASRNFSFKDNFEFIEFEDITPEYIEEHGSVPDTVELWGVIKIYYDGQIPESYKILNLMIGDWVEKNVDALTENIHTELKKHFSEYYPESDHTALDQVDDSAIWTDQLDFMPIINPNDNSLTIELDLILHAEPMGE